jgi:hypothetical protein
MELLFQRGLCPLRLRPNVIMISVVMMFAIIFPSIVIMAVVVMIPSVVIMPIVVMMIPSVMVMVMVICKMGMGFVHAGRFLCSNLSCGLNSDFLAVLTFFLLGNKAFGYSLGRNVGNST